MHKILSCASMATLGCFQGHPQREEGHRVIPERVLVRTSGNQETETLPLVKTNLISTLP